MAGHNYTPLDRENDPSGTAPVSGNRNVIAESLPEEDVSARWANESRVADNPGASAPLISHNPYDNIIDDDDNDSVHEEPQASSSRSTSIWSGIVNTFSRRSEHHSFADGVFGNLVAKDENTEDQSTPNHENGDRPAHLDEDDDLTPPGQPPTYDEASADATPSYWESTLLAAGYGDEILVGEMPVGSIILFVLNVLLCVALGYFGFFLGYMFHTTHAGKNGSLAGLGSLMIASSQQMKTHKIPAGGPQPAEVAPVDPNSFKDGPAIGYVLHPTGRPASENIDEAATGSTWVGYFLFSAGVALIFYACYQYIRAVVCYYKIKQRQLEAEGGGYPSPREALNRVWDSICQYARRHMHSNNSYSSPENSSSTPPPGSPPLEPYQQHLEPHPERNNQPTETV